MDAAIARDTRRIPTDSVDPTVKNFHWGDLTRGLFEAYDRGAHHVLLLDHRGNLTEGPGYNVFALVDGRLVTAGGRVLAVTAVGDDVADARARAYRGVEAISFPGAQWRTDIAANR